MLKSKYYTCFVVLIGCLCAFAAFGQQYIPEQMYDQLKLDGDLDDDATYVIVPAQQRQSHTFSPPDASFTLAIPPSDDASSMEITLPFNFCFYGQSMNKVYINTNGNLSFDAPFSSGTPFTMPFFGHKVIAPFWADVDTRARGGVYYKLTSNALIVNWEDVGYYNQNSQAGNAFQLIISNGTSPLLPFGYTVGFFYDQMQWTTGDASGGIGGFGGAPAQVGVNKGDGQKAHFSGRFNKNSEAYYTHPDSTSGVHWLTSNNIYINPCNNANNRPGMMGENLRDTIGVCVGDTIRPSFYFPAGDVGQMSFVNVSNGFPDFFVQSVQPGAVTQIDMEIRGTLANIGTHTVVFQVADNGNPAAYDILEVVFQIDSLPEDPVISGNMSICANDSTTLSVQSVFDSYVWSTGSNSYQTTAFPGPVYVDVGVNKCVKRTQVTVNGFEPPVSISGRSYLCLPDSVNLSATPGLTTYLWSTGESTPNITINSVGPYTVTVSQNGCVNSDSVYIDTLTDNAMAITRSRPVTCNGDSVVLFGNAMVDSLWWSTGDTATNIKVPDGMYTVFGQVQSSFGQVCMASASTTIGASTFDSIVLVGDTFYCGAGGYAELTTASTYESYMWSNNNTGPYASFIQPGFYELMVLQNQCRDTASFEIVERGIPSPVILGDRYICGGVPAELSLAINFFDSVLWSNGDTTDTAYFGHGQLNVKAWQGGCEGITAMTVNDMIYGVRTQGDAFLCPFDSTRIFVHESFDHYLWNNGDTLSSTYTDAPGQMYCVVTKDTCVATSDTLNVVQLVPEEVEILGDTVMCDSLPGFIFSRVGFSGYLWSNGSTAAGIQYSQPGWYSVTISDINGCRNADSINIKVVPGFQAQITGDPHYCHDDSTLLSVTPGAHYVWSTNDSTQEVLAGSGVYGVTVTASNGCRSTDRLTVSSSSPEVNVYGDSVICQGGQAQVYVSLLTNEMVAWSTGATTDTVWVPTGVNMVTVTDAFGCITSDTFELPENNAPIADFQVRPPLSANVGDRVRITDYTKANGTPIASIQFWLNDSLSWNDLDTALIFSQAEVVLFTQVVIAENGCADTVKMGYQIVNMAKPVNIITPNGDGVNDYLAFPNLDVYAGYTLTVFNRWGNTVYESTFYQNNWDAHGMAEGTYYYVLTSRDGVIVKGYFSILR